MSDGYVYMIQAQGISRVKIGYSSHPERRMLELQTGSPCELKLVGKWPAAPEDELRIHEALSNYRRIGEWFEISTQDAMPVIQETLGAVLELGAPVKRPRSVYNRTKPTLQDLKDGPLGLLRLEIAQLCADAGLRERNEILAEAEMMMMETAPQPEAVIALRERLRLSLQGEGVMERSIEQPKPEK